jgi:hypothetical protein
VSCFLRHDEECSEIELTCEFHCFVGVRLYEGCLHKHNLLNSHTEVSMGKTGAGSRDDHTFLETMRSAGSSDIVTVQFTVMVGILL